MGVVIRGLGLDRAQNTVVGDDLLRGVSGGERKRVRYRVQLSLCCVYGPLILVGCVLSSVLGCKIRRLLRPHFGRGTKPTAPALFSLLFVLAQVTIGEMMIASRLAYFMDEISCGLDASTTLDIMTQMRVLCDSMKNTFIVSLLQPSPQVFELFDNIMLLADGHIIYHGPTESVVRYFAQLGFALPPNKDVADFLQELNTPLAKHWVIPGKAGGRAPCGRASYTNAAMSRSHRRRVL